MMKKVRMSFGVWVMGISWKEKKKEKKKEKEAGIRGLGDEEGNSKENCQLLMVNSQLSMKWGVGELKKGFLTDGKKHG
jgi:hypothetical protein